MTAFGTIYYARKFIETVRIENPMISRCKDGLYRVFIDTGYRVNASRVTCSHINSRFGNSLRFRMDHKSGDYQILAPCDYLGEIREKLSRYNGEGSNCIWQEKRCIKSQENG